MTTRVDGGQKNGGRKVGGPEHVAVIVDVGQTRDLEEIRARALADGAVRAHVLDRREAFARQAISALAAETSATGDRLTRLAHTVIAAAVGEVADIEAVRVIDGGGAVSSPHEGHLFNRPSAPCAPSAEATLTLEFDAGVPVSINGVAMVLPDLIESVSLIAGQFGVGSSFVTPMPAVVVLQAALRATGGDGIATIRLSSGTTEVAIDADQLVTR